MLSQRAIRNRLNRGYYHLPAVSSRSLVARFREHLADNLAATHEARLMRIAEACLAACILLVTTGFVLACLLA